MKIIKIILAALPTICYYSFLALFIFFMGRIVIVGEELLKTDYNCELRDSTYREMKDFLARNKTDSNDFKEGIFGIFGRYSCRNFSRDVKVNAIKEGIRCASVFVRFNDGEGHGLVAFRTVDRGVIFIEPQNDKEVEIAAGIRYWGRIINYYNVFWPEFNSKK